MDKKSEFYVYRYTDRATKAVVYIGKTNCSLKARVDAHKREAAFHPYQCDIDCVRLSNQVETDCVEKFLINYYKPCINLKDKVPMLTEEISLDGLDWIPYERYLASLKQNKQRLSVLKKEALRKSGVLDLVLASQGDVVFLPDMVCTLPTLDGVYIFTDKYASMEEVQGEPGAYLFREKLLPGAKEYLSEHTYEVLSAIWRPVVAASDLSERYLPGFSACEYAYEAVELLSDFAREGYQAAGYPEKFVALLPSKYACAIPLIEKAVGNLNPAEIYGKICFEWAYEQDGKLSKVVEEVSREFVRMVRSCGLWGFKE